MKNALFTSNPRKRDTFSLILLQNITWFYCFPYKTGEEEKIPSKYYFYLSRAHE